jgi:exosome complex RNA-binding protein Rrp42 (RNase PH superfamily)
MRSVDRRSLRELAPIAIIKNVPQVFGSERFHSVANPATIGVKEQSSQPATDAGFENVAR